MGRAALSRLSEVVLAYAGEVVEADVGRAVPHLGQPFVVLRHETMVSIVVPDCRRVPRVCRDPYTDAAIVGAPESVSTLPSGTRDGHPAPGESHWRSVVRWSAGIATGHA